MIAILPILAIAAVPVPPTADELLGNVLRAACFSNVDRVQAVRNISGPGWRTEGPRIQRDITFSVDAPVPRHDSIQQLWEIALREGSARISVWKYDFADPASVDHSSAIIWIRPEQSVAPAAVLRSLGLEMQPAGSRVETPARSRAYSGGLLIRESRPTGWIQHYEVAGASVNPEIQISAMREWGPQHPEQLWRFSCGRRLGPLPAR